jgi:hypothetical protein
VSKEEKPLGEMVTISETTGMCLGVGWGGGRGVAGLSDVEAKPGQ